MKGDGRGDEEGFVEMNVSKTDAVAHVVPLKATCD